MFLDRMFNQGSSAVLEQVLQFTSARQQLIAQNIVNMDTPGYRQVDLSLTKFQSALRDRLDARDRSGPGLVSLDGVVGQASQSPAGILFHDGNNRSAEQLMTDQARNALMHNVAIELLRKQYAMLDMALKERPT